jgi:NADPH:quinone reductase-like Zn-dependent oxidoreductase
MKAIIYAQYGPPDVLQLQDVEKPTPKAGEVLIKVRAATVTAGDVNIRGFTFVPAGFKLLARLMFGLFKPKIPILGTEIAGDVEAVGEGVTDFQKGDPVFGIGSTRLGAYAEYACRPAAGALAHKPANLSYAEAASIPFGASTALFYLRDKAKVQPGQRVLVIGASGGVGVYLVQLARRYGAEVHAVCSAANAELARSLGASRVYDYVKEDFTKSGEQYDVIADTVVGQNSFARCKGSLTDNGQYLAIAGGARELFHGIWTSLTGGKKVHFGSSDESKQDLLTLKELAEQGAIKPVIDRRYPLEQTAEAHRYVETWRKRGSVVIEV